MIVKVQEEHIEKGIKKYNGVRNTALETLFKNGKLEAEVYTFDDGRYLVKYLLLKTAFLYPDESSLLTSIRLD